MDAADNKIESVIADDATTLFKNVSATFAGYIMYPNVWIDYWWRTEQSLEYCI